MPVDVGQMLPIEAELVRERLSALRRVAYKLESLLESLRSVDRQLAHAVGVQRQALLDERERLRAGAEQQRWHLIVQREAMGLRQHDDVLSSYPIPDRR